MKNLTLTLILFMTIAVQAQKKLEKQTDYAGEHVKVELALASSIQVKTWDKSSVKVEASIATEDPKYVDQYELSLEKNSSTIEISTNSEALFKKNGDERLRIDRDKFEFDYVVYVPKEVQLELSSITGDLNSEYLEGDISIELVTGDLSIKKFKGDLNLETVTGKINLPAKDTSFEAKTVMGKIYTAADPDLVTKDNFVGQEMSLKSETTTNRLRLNTVTGDIHLQ